MLKKLVILFIALGAALFALEKLYDYLLGYNRNMKTEFAQLGTINANIVVHGPCEPEWQLDPEIMEKYTGGKSIYNLALNHSDFADNFLLLHLYLKQNKKPEALFLYVTPESFDLRANTFNTYRFTPFLHDPVVAATVKEADPDFYKWRWIPFMKYGYYGKYTNFKAIQGLKHLLTKRQLPYRPNGYTPVENPIWNNHIEGFNNIYKGNFSFQWNPLREKYFRKTIVYAQEQGIPIYLYESPILKQTLPFQINRDSCMTQIKKIAGEYQLDFYVFDDLPWADSTTYFISTLNTSKLGSDKFSHHFGKFLQKEILQ